MDCIDCKRTMQQLKLVSKLLEEVFHRSIKYDSSTTTALYKQACKTHREFNNYALKIHEQFSKEHAEMSWGVVILDEGITSRKTRKKKDKKTENTP